MIRKINPIILEYSLIQHYAYYSQNYSRIIGTPLIARVKRPLPCPSTASSKQTWAESVFYRKLQRFLSLGSPDGTGTFTERHFVLS